MNVYIALGSFCLWRCDGYDSGHALATRLGVERERIAGDEAACLLPRERRDGGKVSVSVSLHVAFDGRWNDGTHPLGEVAVEDLTFVGEELVWQ